MFKIFFFLFCLLFSCNNPAPTGIIQTTMRQTEEIDPFILGGQKLVELEDEDIELFLKRSKWNMKQTNTGLRYEITKTGSGQNFERGATVMLTYSTWLLSGEKVYSSKEDGLKRFVVEKTEEISGLHEAVQLLNSGAKARLIIPSHLAYGASGDGNKIAPCQTIIMKITAVR